MKRLIVAILLICLTGTAQTAPVSVSNLQVTDRGSAGISFDIRLDDISQPEIGGAVPDVAWFTDDDTAIPVVTKWVVVPAGHSVTPRVTNRQSTLIADFADPNTKSISDFTNDVSQVYEVDPPEPVRVGKTVVFRGLAIAPVTIFPLQLDRNSDKGVLNHELSVELDFVPDMNGAPVTRPIVNHSSAYQSTMLDQMMLNPPRRDPGESQYPYLSHILILHLDDLNENQGVPWVDTLATWKRQMGYKVSVEVIDVNMTALRIREFIRDEYYFNTDDPISHLILIGTWDNNFAVHFPTGADELGDHYYSLMDDNDEWSSDITIGRFFVESLSELTGAVIRSVLYEREPLTDDVEWYSKAVFTAESIAAPGGQWVPSMMHLGRWIAYRLRHYGYTQVDTLWAANEEDAGDVEQAVHELLEEGVGLAISRGWLSGCVIGDDAADTERMNPFVIALTCLSHDRGYPFFKAASRNDPIGPIASLIMHGLTHTKGNNNILGWAVLGLTRMNLHQPGVIQLLSKYMVISDLQFADNLWSLELRTTFQAYELLGDPTVNVYTKKPYQIEAEHAESITPVETGFNVYVSAEDEVIADAAVTIKQEDGIQLTAFPGLDGWARFTFEGNQLNEGDMTVTITRPQAFPYHGVVEIAAQAVQIDMAEVDFDDDDGLFGNGDTISTTITFHNSGDDSAADLTVTLSSENPLISFSENEFEIDEILRDDVGEVSFDLILNRSVPAADTVRLDIKIISGEQSWQHAINFVTSAPILTIDGFGENDEPFLRGETVRITPILRNRGELESPPLSAMLISFDSTTAIPRANGINYQSLDEGDWAVPSDNGSFMVDIGDLAIPGSITRFIIVLTAQDQGDQFTQVIPFEITVADERVGDPYGPDSYGYICFDSMDDDWSKSPEYEWIEINSDLPNPDLMGTRIHINDHAENFDSTDVIQLPFDFQYYGESFSEITFNSNGWIAFGSEWSSFTHFRNWRIPSIQGPDAQVCALWQDLINPLPDYNGMFYHYDEDRGAFILEWSNMVVFQSNVVEERNYKYVEFQIILLDENRYPTSTGDGEIKVQYKTFQAVPGSGSDTQYATIGIKNLDGSDGLEYSWWDQYPTRAHPLESEMALLFTVDREPVFGGVQGRVVLEESQEVGLSGAIVRSLRDPEGTETLTDEDGYFRIDPLPAGADIIECFKFGYNYARVEVTINQDEMLELGSITIGHPEIVVADERLEMDVQPGYGTPTHFTIGNDGNGPLSYNIQRRYPDGTQTQYAETWKLGITDIVQDERVFGCQFVGDSLFVTGGGDRYSTDDNMIYVIDNNGNEVRRFNQPSYTGNGFHDLAWTGEHLLGGEESWIIVFDLNGEQIDSIPNPISVNDLIEPYALAWNPKDSTIFTAFDNSDIFKINLNGEVLDTIPVRIHDENVNIFGLAWNHTDDDNMQLYIMDWDSDDDDRRMRLAKVNHITGEGKIVTDLSQSNFGDGRSLTIGYNWERERMSLASIAEDSYRDTLRVYEIGPNSGFLSIPRTSGVVQPGEEVNVPMIMESGNLQIDTYVVGLWIEHNTAADPILKEVALKIDEGSGVGDGVDLPDRFGLGEAYPNPFNGTTRIEFTLDKNVATKLSVYNIAGQRVATLVDGQMSVGNHQIVFDSKDLASGIYFYRLEAQGRSISKRMVLIR